MLRRLILREEESLYIDVRATIVKGVPNYIERLLPLQGIFVSIITV